MSMRPARHDMGKVDWIGSEALGVPGQRTFRLMALAGGVSAQVWLEKEELQALAEAIARMLLQVDAEKGETSRKRGEPTPVPKPDTFPASPDIEFQLGLMGLTYDAERDLIAFEAYDRGDTENRVARLRLYAAREQMEGLQAGALDAVAGGRPRCPLCGTPLSEQGLPHFCPPTNGHQRLGEIEGEA